MNTRKLESNNESHIAKLAYPYDRNVNFGETLTSSAESYEGPRSAVDHEIPISLRQIPAYCVDGFVYHDCSNADMAIVMNLFNFPQHARRKGPRGGVAVPFPVRLHILLESNQDDVVRTIAAWQSHGRSFRIQSVESFVQNIMPR